MSIERVENSISFEDFSAHYFTPEIPVIVKNVTENWPAVKKWRDRYLEKKLLDDKVNVNKLWFQTSEDYLKEDIVQPKIVANSLQAKYSFVRNTNQRIWINYKNHVTLFHSDTNGLFVFNVQVAGKKRWQIIHPDAPLRVYSFTQFPHLNYNEHIPEEIKPYLLEFELNTNEMLFLPPYWYHKVIAEDEVNINVNWVGTKKNRNANRSLRREKEMIKLFLPFHHVSFIKKFVDFFLGSKEKNYLENYAGNGGITHLKELTTNVTYLQATRRFLTEIIGFPMLLKDYPNIKKYEENLIKALENHQTNAN
jgi:hypothetical protein